MSSVRYVQSQMGFFKWLVVSFVLSIVVDYSNGATPKEVCYEEIGCLSLDPPWDQLWGHIPKPPHSLDIKFYITNQRFPDNVEIKEDNNGTSFVSGRPCKVIFHGFSSSKSATWVVDLGKAFIKTENCNVITIDWSRGAAGPNYFQAVANTRTVAAVVAKFLQRATQRGWCSTSNVHLVGQSLGAHLASYVASNLSSVSEITGLDPAQPWFENNANETHLDPSDAAFVQVIHTNVLPFWPQFGLGFSKPSGHVDFYINGGAIQPGCSKMVQNQISDKSLAAIVEWFACSHLKAQEYYIDALNRPFSCKYTGIPWEHFAKEPPSLNGKPCTVGTCQQLGRLTKYLPARGSFYIFTNFTESYCIKGANNNGILQLLGVLPNTL